MGNDWCGVAINPSTDYDIKIDNDSNCSSPYAQSRKYDLTRDFVVANGHIKGTVTHYAQVYFGTSGSYAIEAEWNALDITTGSIYSDSMPAGDVIQIYESYLISGKQYRVSVDIIAGTGDIALYIFKASREEGSRDAIYTGYDYSSESAGSGGDESVSFTADSTGEYGIAVINENGSSASYNISVIEVDSTCPDPNPMTWAEEPAETSTSSIAMVATAATDPSTPIHYYLDFYDSPTGGSGGTDLDWQASTSYTDTGLQANHQYSYRVKARDSLGNPTGYSTPVNYDYTDIETPTGITFGTVTATSIQAQSSNTPLGLTRGSSGLIIYNVTNTTDSDWKQNNTLWTSGSLSPNTQYGFRAQAKNGDGNATGYCSITNKYTLANVPGTAGFTNVTQTSIRANWTASGNPAGTEYCCENTTKGTNSGWTTNTYWDSAGLDCETTYSFRVYSKNNDGIPAGPTILGSQATSSCEAQTYEKYCTTFDEQGEWTDDSKIYVDDSNSRLYWYTDKYYHSAYDNISEVTRAGDLIEFEYHYIDHDDGSTLQDVVFGFTDSMPTTNIMPDNFIGGKAQNYWYDAQTRIMIYKDGVCYLNWGETDHPSGTPAVYKARIEIIDSGTYSVTIWKNNNVVFEDPDRSADLTGISFPLCAAWNKQTQSYSIDYGWYKGYLDFICWTGSVRKGFPPAVLQLLLLNE